jgi:hypothetical protein
MSKGQWQPGQSGNPAGRAPGSGEVAKLRSAIAAHVPEILERLAEAAKSGDAQAARLLLERVLPPVKAIELPVSFALDAEADLVAQARSVLAAIVNGDLEASQAALVIKSLVDVAKIVEVDELTKRIEALEKTKGGAA